MILKEMHGGGKDKRVTAILVLSLIGCGVILSQLLFITVKGDALCLNDGCEIVESLTTVSPLIFNLVGFCFFLSLSWVAWYSQKRRISDLTLLHLLLLAAMAVEGALLSYQLFVAQAFCSYCLVIFSLVVLLNIVPGWRNGLTAMAVLGSILMIFSLLRFGPAVVVSRGEFIDSGTYGTTGSGAGESELYLYFSENCPHCLNVLEQVQLNERCTFNLNPIYDIESETLYGVARKGQYIADTNKLLLKMLNIDTIPVLIEKNEAGYTILRGDQRISSYIEENCLAAPVVNGEIAPTAQEFVVPPLGPAGECSIDDEAGCVEETPALPTEMSPLP